jgi:hypothetical protein
MKILEANHAGKATQKSKCRQRNRRRIVDKQETRYPMLSGGRQGHTKPDCRYLKKERKIIVEF